MTRKPRTIAEARMMVSLRLRQKVGSIAKVSSARERYRSAMRQHDKKQQRLDDARRVLLALEHLADS